MTRVGRLGVIVFVAGLALAACGDDGGDESQAKSTTTSAVSTTVATTVPPTTSAIPVTGPLQRCPTAEEATKSLHDAWANDADGVPGDDARRCASEAAVQTLFGGASGPSPTEMYQGCVEEGPPVRCGYSYEGGGISFLVSGSAANGFVVDSVEFIAD